MALTEAQIETVREIADETSYGDVEIACGELNTAQEAAMVNDVEEWETVRSKHLKIAGGSDGVDMDFQRNRQAIQQRVRTRLGFSVTPPTVFTVATGTRGR